jgi:hypothetical protein
MTYFKGKKFASRKGHFFYFRIQNEVAEILGKESLNESTLTLIAIV